jgi:hypothetical protein
MDNVIVRTNYVAGALIRKKIKREINRYCFLHEIKLNLEEDRGWFDSQYNLTLTGKKEKIMTLLKWLEDLIDGSED